ncbi:vezatin isoform X1 [Oncorhynchus tshawytscha]|uniref:vezatin isoform X1 n=1 Tax=Oncorhynchus tshawytscha TaxID=74940 RepID=UPI001C3D0827|nr:vezatin isoform X1 [Oncorhynchus tshawytscha]
MCQHVHHRYRPIMQNSPLFHYLQDLGHTDFEACPTVPQEDECGGGEGTTTSLQDSLSKPTGGRLWRLADALWRRSPFHQAASAHRLEQQLDCVFGQYAVQCILDQDVLLQEDVELIELLDPSLLTLGASPSGSPRRDHSLPCPRLLASPSQWDVAVLVGLAAVLLGLSSLSAGAWSLAVIPWCAAVMGWVGLRGAGLWRQGRMQRAAHAQASELQTMVLNSKALTSLARKSLRLLQETEVISRGFTLLLDRVSAASSFSRAGLGAGPRGQQLIGLRKAVYRALRSAFRASRRATCHMLKAYPLNSEIDNVTNYVSAVPLKELGMGLGTEHLTDEEAQELTDDYSLPALKVLFQLWVGQSSECFRRLALLLSPRRLEEPREDWVKGETPPPIHRSVATVTQPLHGALAGCLGDMQRSYEFHRYFETQRRTQGSDRVGRAQQKCRELNTLHTSVRSLQLHLRALLNEMIILEDDLEKLMVTKEAVEVTVEGYQDLQERLGHLQPHMQASAGCWEDTVGQVERMLRRANTCPGTPDGPEQCLSPVPCTPAPTYTLILDRDPVPEEQELEAYVSDSEDENGWAGSVVDMLSPEERERQRREREESRRVLSELKAVLGQRASERERRKWKQLLFNDQAAVMPIVSAETSIEYQMPSDPLDALTLVGVANPGVAEGNHLSERLNNEEEDWIRDERPLTEAEEKALTEFCCGEAEEKGEEGEGWASVPAGTGKALYQYDGLPDEGAGLNRPDLLQPRVPTITVMDRLTELHGSAALSFNSALAAQVAARSYTFANMEEQTFGDSGEEDEGEKRSLPDGQTCEKD